MKYTPDTIFYRPTPQGSLPTSSCICGGNAAKNSGFTRLIELAGSPGVTVLDVVAVVADVVVAVTELTGVATGVVRLDDDVGGVGVFRIPRCSRKTS